MAQLFDSNIITSGRDVNMFDAVDRGLKMGDEARARQQQVNYEAALKQYGAAAYAGDRAAQDILAQYDPAGMRTIRQEDETAAQNARIREQELQIEMRKVYNDEMSKLSEAEQKAARAEAERIAKGALAIDDEATWNAYVISNGGTPEEYPFALKDQMIYTVLPPDVVQDYVKTRGTGVDEFGFPVAPGTAPAPIAAPAGAATGVTPPAATPAAPASGNMLRPRLSFGDLGQPETAPATATPDSTPAATVTPTAPPTTWRFSAEVGNRKAPAGFTFASNGSEVFQVPERGGEKDNSESLKVDVGRVDDLIALTDNILLAEDADLAAITGSLVEGGSESYLSGIGNLVDAFRGPVTRSLIADIDTLKGSAQVLGQQLAKELSGTGAGSDTESAAIRASIANLSRTNDPVKLKEEVARLRALMMSQREKAAQELATRSKVYGADLAVPPYEYPKAGRERAAPSPSVAQSGKIESNTAAARAARLEELRRKAQGN